MTSEDVKSELEKIPFVPLRIHLVSGKTVEIVMPGIAWMLQNALFVLHDVRGTHDGTYDVISLRNIERLEQLTAATGHGGNSGGSTRA